MDMPAVDVLLLYCRSGRGTDLADRSPKLGELGSYFIDVPMLNQYPLLLFRGGGNPRRTLELTPVVPAWWKPGLSLGSHLNYNMSSLGARTQSVVDASLSLLVGILCVPTFSLSHSQLRLR